MANRMSEIIAQWETENDKTDFVHLGMSWRAGLQSIKIGPIIERFKCQELRGSDCLRFVDPKFGAVFNERQVETIEEEIKTLLALELSQDERKDCEKLRDLVELLEPPHRSLMYFRFCSNEHSRKHLTTY